MKYRSIFSILLSLITISTVAFIFCNSLTVSEVSNAQSNAVADTVRPIVDPSGIIPTITFDALVRKAAHLLEFGLLGCELMGLATILVRTKRRNVLSYICTPLFFALLIAVIDEYIQSFTGRTSAVKDVLIDFTGIIAGVLCVWAVTAVCFHIIRKHKRVSS